ncbi:tetratricopeptide repeat protein [Streptomyces sp. NPDC013953]|uniref:tetratricopeptide repeat protein n=1 Tax=Streptomyces sp. NPDC013953 TaxID=3364868 RepID=UPI0036F9A18E
MPHNVTARAGNGGLAVGHVGQVTYYTAPRPGVVWPHQVGALPRQADSFQNRPALVRQLERPSTDESVGVLCHVLAGTGGVGKTQLAAHHARHAWADGSLDLLVWVTATTREEITAVYAQAAVDILGADPTNPERAATAFLAWLEPKRATSAHNVTPPRWLIVLDDVADPADLAGLWPPTSPHGHTLITTRRRDAALTGAGRRLVPVSLFTPREATAYLTDVLASHHRRQPLDQIAALAEALDHLPLALSQAAAYLVDAKLDCATYRGRLADRARCLSDVLPEPTGLPDDQTVTVAAAWSLSVERADRLRPVGLARPMLQLAAVLDPNGIPHSVLTGRTARTYLARHRTPTEPGLESRAEVSVQDATDTLRALHRLNLVDHTPGSPYRAVRVHQLVQRSARDQMTAQARDELVVTAATALIAAWPLPDRDALLAQTLRANTAALRHYGEEALYRPEPHPVLLRAGNSLGTSGQVAAAYRHYRKLVRAVRARLGPDHPRTLTLRHEIARWQGSTGDALGAKAAFEELLTDRVRVLGQEHAQTLTTQHSLAYWRGQTGDTAGAIVEFEELLATRTRLFGASHPRTLITRSSLASWRGMAGDTKGALAAVEELLADQLRSLPPDHMHVLATRHNLAYWRAMSGDVPGAVTAFEELVSDRLRVLGQDHPLTLMSRHELARWQLRAGDVPSAKAAFDVLLADRLRVLGPDHPQTLTTRNELARCQGEQGDVPGALTALEELLADQLRVLGPDDLRVLTTRHEQAHWRGRRGDVHGAIVALEDLLADRLRVLGPDHPQILTTRDELSRWQEQLGQRSHEH